ncbi:MULTISPECIES: DUF3313 domain-containing protein [unclassified Bradyrhizobium]|uniref:DUF3313 domain-containing protein n=1 Tax=unclassified Bradyrhizobium TaxID=2631580 RepID=UPI0028E89D3D|nr:MULTISPECIES: DUF3313 domain-containing protein [unclassified Bradyrhizobium]
MYLSRVSTALTLLGAALLAGCASTAPVKYQGLAATSAMSANTSTDSNHVPFSYAMPGTNWASYSGFVLERVAIYTGTDSQFGDLSDADKHELATYMHEQFSTALSKRLTPVTASAPGVLRIRLTLTGVETSQQVISTATKLVPAGAVLNTIATVGDKQAAFSGSVTYVVEIYDASSRKLLRSFVSKQYPLAIDVLATIGPLEATRSGIRRGADALSNQLK